MNSKPSTPDEIKKAFSQTLAKEVGVDVETVIRGENKWTFAGSPEAVRKVAEWIQENRLLKLEGIECLEDDPTFACAFMYR